MKRAFTLIEVMVAVMIISVVIASMIQLSGNSSLLLENAKKKSEALQYLSLLRQSNYGFEKDEVSAARLLERFDLDDDLRRELKTLKLKIDYKETQRLDLSEFDENASGEAEDAAGEQTPSTLVLEIGQSTLSTSKEHVSVVRIRLQ